MTIDLSGKRTLVTGGNRGIGLAAVRALAEAGADVTFTARSQGKIDEAMGQLNGLGSVRGRVCDVTDRDGMSALIGEGLDILINNAGVITPIGPLDEVPIEEWATNIETNLIAAFHAIQRAVVAMRGSGGGTIVNLSSGAARSAMEGWSAYCSGKAGLAMLTRCVHHELGDRGIRIFGFAPGVVDTEMQGSIRQSGINPVSKLRREDLAPPHEPAHAMAWLCTPEADKYVGQEVDVRDEAFRRDCGLEVRA